jgi:hypothetical protein
MQKIIQTKIEEGRNQSIMTTGECEGTLSPTLFRVEGGPVCRAGQGRVSAVEAVHASAARAHPSA